MVIGGTNTPTFSGRTKIDDDNIKLKLVEVKSIGPGIMLHYRLIK
jgi:hypothetical protein